MQRPMVKDLRLSLFLLYIKNYKKYGSKKVAIYDYALSDEETTATFVHVIDRPAISGLKNRAVTEQNHFTEKIQVQVKNAR